MITRWPLESVLELAVEIAREGRELGLSRSVVRVYDKRGRADQWTREGKQSVKMRSSPVTVPAHTRCGRR